MAPEILRYEKYDAKADLWSVGAVVYEAAVGRPPFRAQNHIELLKKIDHARSRVHFPDEVCLISFGSGVLALVHWLTIQLPIGPQECRCYCARRSRARQQWCQAAHPRAVEA